MNGAGAPLPPAPVAPGSIVSIYGSNFAPGASHNGMSATPPFPRTLNGAQVLMNGIAAPLIYVDSFQINAQVPWEVSGASNLVLQVASNGIQSNVATVALASAAPGVSVATHAVDGTPVTTAKPAVPGEYLTVYCTGLGPVTNQPASGAAASSNPLSTAIQTPSVTIGGVTANVIFAGLTPGFAGLYQVNLQVPYGSALGNAVPLVLNSETNSASLTIAIAAGAPPPPTLAPAVSLSTSTLSFGNQALNTSSGAQSVTLIETGTAGLSITNIAITGGNSGDFSEIDNCIGTLAANAACTISVTFRPTANGTRTASLSIVDSAGNSPQVVSLTGGGGLSGGSVSNLSVTQVGKSMISLSVVGGDCGAGCYRYSNGVQVVLTAVPSVTSPLIKIIWSGCDSTLGSTCTVTMNGDRSVTATVTARTGSGRFDGSIGTSSGCGLAISWSINGTITVAGNVGSSVLTGSISGTISGIITAGNGTVMPGDFSGTRSLTNSSVGYYSVNFSDIGFGDLAMTFDAVWNIDDNSAGANATGSVTLYNYDNNGCDVRNPLTFSIGSTGSGINTFPIAIGPFTP